MTISLLVVVSACGAGDDATPLGETGETGGEQVSPLPGGDDCELNWYDLDGAAVPMDLDGPEALSASLAVRRSTVAFTAPAKPVRPASDEPVPIDPRFADISFDEFAQQYATPFQGDWFVDGDQAMTDAGLHALYDYLHGQAATPTGAATPAASTYTVGDFDAAWSSRRKLSLTWCIGRIMPSPLTDMETHAEHVALAVETMEWATRAWERTGDVNFIHLAEYDSPESHGSGDCQPGENGIAFRVRTGPDCTLGCGGRTYAGAIPYNEFLDPSDVDGGAEIVLGLQRFFWSENEARINALHELGHVMGFTHEHLQWIDDQVSANCKALDDIDWRGVTPPDPDSVMAYDDCVGVNQNQPRLSALDRLGSYYAYTWGHRRSLMMGAVNQVDDYAYDGSGRTGIMWQKSRSAELEIWNSTGDPGATIEFSVESVCADGATPPCVGAFDVEGRTRTSNAFLTGTTSDLDLLFHGPGPLLADSLIINDGLARDPWLIDLDSFAVPVVGSFGAGIDDQILLYRPGPTQDALLIVDESELTVIPMNYPDYAYPLAGRYRGFGDGGMTSCGTSLVAMNSRFGSGRRLIRSTSWRVVRATLELSLSRTTPNTCRCSATSTATKGPMFSGTRPARPPTSCGGRPAVNSLYCSRLRQRR